ncbi:hypothetical protein IVB34_47745 [Bradyrhizobium sp. 2]|uniref:hypothetical protein n=1 Tax=unclassified Bradyrhizobium TaxID=2631580 RepID=UPI001FF80AD7|nr:MULTISPECIES: hypothetical protein [unclassified Bradyrhizobium]MCK1465783.1 hypothetical protein [Bradyrhizobium sp. 2]MCK1520231.1 hypothetical protein [Bradyrhizobium sp. 17]
MALSSKRQYWSRMYRLLDPNAYTYSSGTSMSLIVPAGTTWYATNMWFVYVNGNGPYFHRKLDCRECIELPAGTVITSTSGQSGFIYYCDYAAATAPATDPEEAYYARLNQLTSIQISSLTASITVGSARGTVVSASFPSFTSGILRGVANNEVSWTILSGGSMNTMDEISDDHQQRFTSELLMPFKTSIFTGIQVRSASVSGNATDTSLAGTGTILYQVLPGGW